MILDQRQKLLGEADLEMLKRYAGLRNEAQKIMNDPERRRRVEAVAYGMGIEIPTKIIVKGI